MYLIAFSEFYYTKQITSNLKNAGPMYLTTNVIHMPLSDTIFDNIIYN